MPKILDPLIEILAIKLFEHDHEGKWPVRPERGGPSWLALPEEDRDIFRAMARGDTDLPT